jgi:hypothetical protein
MRKSKTTATLIVATAFSFGLWSVPSWAQATDPTVLPDPIQTVQRLVALFFPELSGHGNRSIVYWSDPYERPLSANRFRREFGFNVAEPGQDLLGKNALLDIYCAFGLAGEIEQIALHSRAVHQAENEALKARVDEHPEWSDTEVLAELTNAGGKYGPTTRSELLNRLRLVNRLEALFEARAEVLSLTFEDRVDDRTKRARLDWCAEVRITRPLTHDAATLVLYFEPFDGALVDIVRAH